MFYLTSFYKNIGILPKDIKNKDIDVILTSNIKELEGNFMGKKGYIICILKYEKISKGNIGNETGVVNYNIKYEAITFKLLKDEIIFTMPVFINEHGFFCEVGPIVIFVSQWKFPNWKYNSEEKSWINRKKSIKIGDNICVKIYAVKINSNDIGLLANLVDSED